MLFFITRLLCRAPVKTILSVILLITAVMALCISVSLYNSSIAASDWVESNFTTLLYPICSAISNVTPRNIQAVVEYTFPMELEDMKEREYSEHDISSMERQIILYDYYSEVIHEIESGTGVKKDDRRMYLGAVSGITALRAKPEPIIFFGEHLVSDYGEPMYAYNPYANALGEVAVLDVTVLELLEDSFETSSYYKWEVNINNVLAGNPLTDSSTIKVNNLWYEIMEVGGRYIIALDSYSKHYDEWFFLFTISKNGWLNPVEVNGVTLPDLFSSSATKIPLDAGINTDSASGLASSTGMDPQLAEVWFDIIGACNDIVTMVPVLTTDSLDFLPTFATNQSPIIEGRGLTAKDSELGNNVCVISADYADWSGISIGDELRIKISEIGHFGHMYGGISRWMLHTPNPVRYSVVLEATWEVVGIYRSTGFDNALRDYYLHPNTVIVPAASIPLMPLDMERGEDPLYDSGSAWGYPEVLKTWYLPSSQAESFLDNMDPRFAELIMVVDQGYSHVHSLVETIKSNAFNILIASVSVSLLVALLFFYLNITRSRKSMGILRSIGFSKTRVASLYIVVSLFIWLLSSFAAYFIVPLVYDEIERGVFDSVLAADDFDEAFSDMGNWADQGYNPFTEETDLSKQQLMDAIYQPSNQTQLLKSSLLAQSVVFVIMAVMYITVCARSNLRKLLRGE